MKMARQNKNIFTLTSEDGELFATINLENAPRMHYICKYSSIQMISRLNDAAPGNSRYLLGPGPDTVELLDLVMEQYDGYMKEKNSAKANSVNK